MIDAAPQDHPHGAAPRAPSQPKPPRHLNAYRQQKRLLSKFHRQTRARCHQAKQPNFRQSGDGDDALLNGYGCDAHACGHVRVHALGRGHAHVHVRGAIARLYLVKRKIPTPLAIQQTTFAQKHQLTLTAQRLQARVA